MPTSDREEVRATASRVPDVRHDRSGDRLVRQVQAGARVGMSEMRAQPGVPSEPVLAWWMSRLRGGDLTSCGTGRLRVVDLFSGVGGLSLGACSAATALGYVLEPVLAVDTDTSALKVYQQNFPGGRLLDRSMAELVDHTVHNRGSDAWFPYDPEVIDADIEGLVGAVDLVLAGPPCQGHSNLNNRTRREDPRNELYLDAVGFAVAVKAPMVVIENVASIRADRTQVLDTAVALLEKSGYHVSQAVLKADALHGAQTRHRHFLVATFGVHAGVDEVAERLGAEGDTRLTIWDVIGDLEDVEPDHFMDEVPVLSQENQERVNYLHDQGVHELPDDRRPDCHRDGHSYPAVYGRLYQDKPAPTITTGFMTPGRGRYVHPTRRRVITPREAARLQGFPDSFDFSLDEAAPSRKLLAKWIGDAVPCVLGHTAVMAALTSLEP